MFFFFNNRKTFHDLTLRTLYGNPNLRVLITPQQLTLGKFKVSLIVRYVPRIMCLTGTTLLSVRLNQRGYPSGFKLMFGSQLVPSKQ